MNLILSNSDQVNIHTRLKDVFLPFRDEVIHFNWLISDYEVNTSEIFDNGIAWLSGEEILDFADNNDIQFIWGVISAFRKNYQIDLDNISVIPVAEEHKTLWTNNPSIQHPEAIIEIVSIDSSATILLSKDEAIAKKYRDYYIDAKDLNGINRGINLQKEYVESVLNEYISKEKLVKKDITYVSHGHGYNVDSYFDIVTGNIRYELYENYSKIPCEKDAQRILDIFINSINL